MKKIIKKCDAVVKWSSIFIFLFVMFVDAHFVDAQDNWRMPMMEHADGPIVIFKADDLGSMSTTWQTFFDIINEYEICTSVGVISGQASSSVSGIRQLHDDYPYVNELMDPVSRFEFWNHSSEHVGFAGLSMSSQYNNLKECQDFFNNILGFKSHAFGPPGNSMDENTALALNYYNTNNRDLLKVWMGVGFPASRPGWNTLNSFEYGSDNSHLIFGNAYDDQGDTTIIADDFKVWYQGNAHLRLFSVIQIHPAAYNATGVAELREVIRFLKNRNTLFVTPSYLYNKANTEHYCGDYYGEEAVNAVNSLAAGFSPTLSSSTPPCQHTIIHDGANVAFTASQGISLLPGFSSERGSLFRASITSSAGGRVKTIGGSENLSSHKTGSLSSTVTVYPNPNNGSFVLDFGDQQINNATITIYNLQGQEVKRISVSSFSKETIDLSNQATGIYTVQISTNRFLKTYKIVKK